MTDPDIIPTPIQSSAQLPGQPQPVNPQTESTGIRKWRLLAACGVALIATLGLIIFWPGAHPTKVTPEEATDYDNSVFSQEAVVGITTSGFVPSSLSIKPHTRVNWENKDSVSHHLILTDPKIQDGPPVAKENSPNLPNNDEVPSGGGFAHVFEKPGIYGFHDADNPTANVIVIVHK